MEPYPSLLNYWLLKCPGVVSVVVSLVCPPLSSTDSNMQSQILGHRVALVNFSGSQNKHMKCGELILGFVDWLEGDNRGWRIRIIRM